jgi:hypothetical protein
MALGVLQDMSEGLEIEFDEKNKRIGILIAIMAAVLALVEAGGNNAAQDALRGTIEATDTWAFYQAKTIRMTTLNAQARSLELEAMDVKKGPRLEEMKKTIEEWRATANRYDSDPQGGEGRKELLAKARKIEAERDDFAAANGVFDLSSSALQLAILLASASVVTSLVWLAWLGAGLGAIGGLLGVLAVVAPHLLGG